MKTKIKEENHAIANASGWMQSIQEMVDALETENDSDREAAEQTIHESGLSVEVRPDWYTLDRDSDKKPAEYRILLTTGGPAL